MVSLRINDGFTTLWHAASKVSEDICTDFVPLLDDGIAQRSIVAAAVLLDLARQDRPEVLNRVEIGRIGREVEDADSCSV